MDTQNIAMVGLGAWGKNILRNLYELKAIRTACDCNFDTLCERKKEFPDIAYTASFEDILKDSQITAVCIATPASTHYQLVKMALNSHKDVFVEKPLAFNTRHGKELMRIAAAKKKILMVGHILHYHPAIIRLKSFLEEGGLGQVQYIYSNRLNIGKLRVEENILWSFAPHDISVILMLIGSEPVGVDCFAASYVNKGISDVTMTTLEFKKNIKAHIFVSWLHPFKEHKLIVVGSKAMAVFDDLTKEKLFIYPHKIEWHNGKIPVAHKAEYYCLPVEEKEPLNEEILHFIECVHTRQTPRTDIREGLRVLGVLEKAEKRIRIKS